MCHYFFFFFFCCGCFFFFVCVCVRNEKETNCSREFFSNKKGEKNRDFSMG